MIYIIGDSNVSVFSKTNKIQRYYPLEPINNSPYFFCYRLGPNLAYKINENIESPINKILDSIDLIKKKIYYYFVLGKLIEECIYVISQSSRIEQ